MLAHTALVPKDKQLEGKHPATFLVYASVLCSLLEHSASLAHGWQLSRLRTGGPHWPPPPLCPAPQSELLRIPHWPPPSALPLNQLLRAFPSCPARLIP